MFMSSALSQLSINVTNFRKTKVTKIQIIFIIHLNYLIVQ